MAMWRFISFNLLFLVSCIVNSAKIRYWVAEANIGVLHIIKAYYQIPCYLTFVLYHSSISLSLCTIFTVWSGFLGDFSRRPSLQYPLSKLTWGDEEWPTVSGQNTPKETGAPKSLLIKNVFLSFLYTFNVWGSLWNSCYPRLKRRLTPNPIRNITLALPLPLSQTFYQ